MTKEQFKEYVCKQIDLMDNSQLQEFSEFINSNSTNQEHVAEELIVIKGEFKKLTKLVSSMEKKFDEGKKQQQIDELKIFIEFDSFLKNSKDAIESLPKASLFNKAKVNRSINSLQDGFISISESYEEILKQIGIERVAKIGDTFDSNLHEAIEVIESKTTQDSTIVEVLEEGFIYNNKIINYAKVKVNRWKS